MFPRISLGFFPRTRGPFRNSCCDFSEKFASTFTGLSAAVPIKNPPGRPPWVFFEASVRIPSDVFLRNFKFFFRDIPRNSLLVLLKKFFYGLLLELLQKCIWSSINPSYNNSIDVSTYLSRIFPWDSIFFLYFWEIPPEIFQQILVRRISPRIAPVFFRIFRWESHSTFGYGFFRYSSCWVLESLLRFFKEFPLEFPQKCTGNLSKNSSGISFGISLRKFSKGAFSYVSRNFSNSRIRRIIQTFLLWFL